MDDLEVKLDNLDKLFEEAHNMDNADEPAQDEVFIEIKPQNKVGTLKTKYKYRIVPQEDIFADSIKEDIKEDTKEIVEHVDEVVNNHKDEIVVNEEDTKLITLPNELLPTVQKEEEYPLMVQKEQVKALTLTKVGSIVTSILLALVTLTIGVILAIVFR